MVGCHQDMRRITQPGCSGFMWCCSTRVPLLRIGGSAPGSATRASVASSDHPAPRRSRFFGRKRGSRVEKSGAYLCQRQLTPAEQFFGQHGGTAGTSVRCRTLAA
jgi:hypothetical protein